MRSADLAAHHAPRGRGGFLAAVASPAFITDPRAASVRFARIERRRRSSASDDDHGGPTRPGSRAAVLDEGASRHALRLRASEEGSGSKGAILASGASNQT
jgi:hypothetical protein